MGSTLYQPGKNFRMNLLYSSDKIAKLWHTESTHAQRVFIGHTKDVQKAIFHPNLHYIISASEDRTTRIWEIKSGD